MRSRLNPFAPPFAPDLAEQERIDSHNRAVLRQTYPGYDIGRLALHEYDALVRTTQALFNANKPADPIGDWFSANGFKEQA